MNFKKHISILVAFFLLVSNVGMALNVHYCGQTVASVSIKTIFINHNSENGCCGAVEKKSHCCKNKTVHIQKKSDVSILKSVDLQKTLPLLTPIWKPITGAATAVLDCTFLTVYCCNVHAPPLFKLFSQYVFYA